MSRDRVVKITTNKDGTTTREVLSEGWKPKRATPRSSPTKKSSSSSSSSTKKLTKTEYRDVNSMTPQEARKRGYKFSGSVGWFKVGTEEKESKKRISKNTPTRPKYTINTVKSGSLSQKQISEGGFKLSGATGELMQTPATNENINKYRQHLRDLNRYYDRQIRAEVNRPSGESDRLIYNLDGQTVTRKDYIRALKDARSEIVRHQKQATPKPQQQTPQQRNIITLPKNNKATNEINALNPMRTDHPNRSTRTDIGYKHADVFTREQQVERDVSRAVLENTDPLNRFGVKLATFESYKGKTYLGAMIGSSKLGQKAGLKGTNKAGHINTPDDIVFDYMSELRKKTSRDTEIKNMLSGTHPKDAPSEFLEVELKHIRRDKRSLYLKNIVSNPTTQATAIAVTPSIIGASPLLTSVAGNPFVLAGTVFLGAKETANIKSEYDIGNYASAIGESATVLGGLAGAGGIAGVKYANKRTTTIKDIQSMEMVTSHGTKKIKIGKGTAHYKVTLSDRSNIDRLFGRPGKVRHETVKGKLDIFSDKNHALMKIDFMGDKGLNSQLVNIKHGKISPDQVVADSLKIKTATATHRVSKRTQLIKTETRTRTSITPLKERSLIPDISSSLKLGVTDKTTHIQFNKVLQTHIKATKDIDLFTTLKNLRLNRAGTTTRETSILTTQAKRTTIDNVLYFLKTSGKRGATRSHKAHHKTVHKSDETVVQLSTPDKISFSGIVKGLSHTQNFKHRPTHISKTHTANKDVSLAFSHNFNKISTIKPPTIHTPKPTATARVSKALSTKRKGSLNPVRHTPTYQDNKLNLMFQDVTTGKTIITPKAPTIHGRTNIVNKNMLKSGSQSALRNAYLHKPAVNTANFGRMAMTSLSSMIVTDQKKDKRKNDRINRIRNPISTEQTNDRIRDKIIKLPSLRHDFSNPQKSRNRTPARPRKTPKNQIQDPPYFNPIPHPSINIIPRIDTPTPRRLRLPGGKRDSRIIPRKRQEQKGAGLSVIERQLKDINSII